MDELTEPSLVPTSSSVERESDGAHHSGLWAHAWHTVSPQTWELVFATLSTILPALWACFLGPRAPQEDAEAPEEDPGILTVVVEKGDRAVLVGYAGPTLTGDPRDLDMPISVDDLFAIAHDARTDVTTSAEAVEAGRDLVSKD